jgi:hypothetical protein
MMLLCSEVPRALRSFVGNRSWKRKLSGLAIALCAIVAGQPSWAQEAEATAWVDAEGLNALMTAAAVMWILLISVIIYQFRRQRRLSDELARMEQSLKDLRETADRAEEECSTSNQQTNSSS